MSEQPLERTAEEARLLSPLLAMLSSARRLRADSIAVYELPWHGRRVDLATLTRGGVLSAYELKLGGFGRVLEQAVYNRLSFDRSWVVVDRVPNGDNLAMARRNGVVVIVVQSNAKILAPARQTRNDAVLRRRLTAKILSARGRDV